MHTPALCIIVVIVKFFHIMKKNLLNMKYNANLFPEWVESLVIHSKAGTDQMYLNTIIPLLMMASHIETLSQITKNQTLLEVC